MALSTYDELCAALAVLLNRTDLDAAIPDFIRLCEAAVDGRADLARHRRRICRSSAVIDAEYVATPTDLLSVQSFRLDGAPTVPLAFVDADAMERMVAGGDEGATPRWYTIVGTEFRFFPAPGAGESFTGRLHVHERLPALAGAGTNWLLAYYPDVYLYGAALHAAPYLADDERIAVWAELYEGACRRAASADPFPTVKSRLRADAALTAVRRTN